MILEKKNLTHENFHEILGFFAEWLSGKIAEYKTKH